MIVGELSLNPHDQLNPQKGRTAHIKILKKSTLISILLSCTKDFKDFFLGDSKKKTVFSLRFSVHLKILELRNDIPTLEGLEITAPRGDGNRWGNHNPKDLWDEWYG